MKDEARWRPSKYVYRAGRLRASRRDADVGAGSRLIGDLVAGFYDRTLPLHCRGRLLDMGCGKAPLYAAYRPQATTITCIDWEASPHGVSHVDRSVDLGGPVPFDDAQFDTILLSDVLEHLPDPQRALCEAARLLAPGGVLIANTPFLYGIHEQPHDFFRVTCYGLRRLVAHAGLELVELEALGGAPEVLADLTAKLVVRTPLAGRPVALALQGAAASLRRWPWWRRLADRSAAKFPLGYGLVARRPAATREGNAQPRPAAPQPTLPTESNLQ
jgi:SAM-dependent methyltransferase